VSVAAVSDRRTLRTPRSHPGLRERRYSAQEMFVGHYSVASAAKLERNKIPLWVLFVAVQFLDYIWATLVLLGIEKLRVIKGLTASIAMRYLKFLLRAGAALQEDEQNVCRCTDCPPPKVPKLFVYIPCSIR